MTDFNQLNQEQTKVQLNTLQFVLMLNGFYITHKQNMTNEEITQLTALADEFDALYKSENPSEEEMNKRREKAQELVNFMENFVLKEKRKKMH
jgi:signal transduction histidine kinase